MIVGPGGLEPRDDAMVGADFLGCAGYKMAAKVEHRNDAAAGEDGVDIVLHHHGRDFSLAHEIAQMLEQAQRLRRR